jgi:nucleoid-associated protein YgaU
MSVASDFPPVVHIPDRARSAVLAPRAVRAAHLSVVRDRPHPEGPLALAVAPAPRLAFGGQLSDLRSTGLATAPLRLTRRGVVALTVAVLSVGVAMLLIAHWSAAPQPSAPSGASVVTVHAGDTLWSIARTVAPQSDPRAVVDHLMAANHLTSVTLSPGQTLNVK